MLGLLFYGRFEKEKGFDQLILAIKELNKRKVDFEIFIYGKGSLENDLLEAHSKNVHYFGWKPLNEIKKILPNIDYCLMPSEFLETFGLSALNALSWGVPVIGYKKGGLEPFIFQECNLFLAKGDTTSERIVSMVENLAKKTNPERLKDKEIFEGKIKKLLLEYMEDARYERFLKLSGFKDNNKKVLIVSDFINKAGGIETYIHDVKDLLESRGYEVILRGSSLPSGSSGKRKRFFGLFLSPFNFWSANNFKTILKEENPDLIWFNSLLRWLGPNVVKVAGKWRKEIKPECKFWMMYHDFGYFYPLPSQLYYIEDCKTPLTRKSFLSAYKGKRLITKLAVLGKYYVIQPLKKALKKYIDLHLTPSDCVTIIAQKSYNLLEKKCKTFPHFIQK